MTFEVYQRTHVKRAHETYQHTCCAWCRGNVHVSVTYSPYPLSGHEIRDWYAEGGHRVMSIEPASEAPEEGPNGFRYAYRYLVAVEWFGEQ